MKISRERFESDSTFDEFRKAAKKHEGLWNGLYEHSEIPEDAVIRLKNLPGKRHVLVLAEDWCGDAASIVPILARMADAAGDMIDLRVVRRDENLDIMDAHLTHGGRSIPLAIVYDEDMNELGSWGPRPAPAQAMYREKIRALEEGRLKDKVEDVYRLLLKWYRQDRGRHIVDEFLLVLERGGRLRE